MAVRIVFLGPLRDLANGASIEIDAPVDWERLIAAVRPQIAAQLEDDRVNIACGGKVLSSKRELHAEDGDEIALLPPVSGG